jgi:perosamine synthetase
MDEIMTIARKYDLAVIEDAAEAHGALFFPEEKKNKGRYAGTIGRAGCFSFYANKIITTGEGGMVVTNDDRLAERARLLKDLAHSPQRRFLHTEVAFNYRMTNVQAAIGLAQLEEVEKLISIKQRMAETYKRLLCGVKGLVLPQEKAWARSVYWMYAVLIEKDFGLSRDALMAGLLERGVDTRTLFIPVNRQPVFRRMGLFQGQRFPVAEGLARKGLYLPSGLALTESQMAKVSADIKEIQARRSSGRTR